MKLTLVDQEVIAHYPLRMRDGLSALSRELRIAGHRLRYSFARLVSEGVLVPAAAINISALGLKRFTTFVATNFPDVRSRNEFENRMSTHHNIAFAARLAGTFDYEIGIVASSEVQARSELAVLFADVRVHMSRRVLLTRTKSTLLQRKYLSRKRAPQFFIPLDASLPMASTDATDQRILTQLALQPTTPLRQLAGHARLSLPAVHQRVKRLTDLKVYHGTILLTHFEKYGGLFFSCLIALRSFRQELVEKIEIFAKEAPHVTHFVTCHGDFDLELGIEVQSHDQLRDVQDQITRQLGSLIFDYLIVPRVSTLKFALYPRS